MLYMLTSTVWGWICFRREKIRIIGPPSMHGQEADNGGENGRALVDCSLKRGRGSQGGDSEHEQRGGDRRAGQCKEPPGREGGTGGEGRRYGESKAVDERDAHRLRENGPAVARQALEEEGRAGRHQ